MADAIYLRKSRKDLEAEAHGDGETLARHRAALLANAKRMGRNVTEIYAEVVSGDSIAARPEMQRLMKDVEAGMYDAVHVMEVERLARGDSLDQGLVARAFKYSGTLIITPVKTYFNSVIDWVSSVFSDVLPQMRGLEWGRLYELYHKTPYSMDAVSQRVHELMGDPFVRRNNLPRN